MTHGSNAHDQPVAVVAGVSRRFGSVTAVDDMSFTIRAGETVALLGPNGAGKTTTVEILLGLATPDTGTARLFGGSPRAAIAAGWVGAMLQDGGLPHGVAVAELVGVVARLYPDPLPVDEALRLADIEEVAGRRVQRLSGGQRQRVRLALALAGRPKLLVLDEPTAALDVDARRVFWARTRGSTADGTALLFATHRLEEADAVADRVIVIADGRVVADAPPQRIKAGVVGMSRVSVTADGLSADVLARLPGVRSVEPQPGRLTLLTTDPDTTVRALLTEMPAVEGLEITRPGIEEAFLALTRQEDQ